jgi:hypothetical protein
VAPLLKGHGWSRTHTSQTRVRMRISSLIKHNMMNHGNYNDKSFFYEWMTDERKPCPQN